MERQYRLMHRLGLTPWASSEPPVALTRLVAGDKALRPGLALDLGCGSGEHAAYLAERGWTVLAVDVSARAIAAARSRSSDVRWLCADVATLADSSLVLDVAGRVDLVLDIGCLHGLDITGRAGWARAVARAASPTAAALIRASTPAQRLIAPRGISFDEIAALLGSTWTRTEQDGDTYLFRRQPV